MDKNIIYIKLITTATFIIIIGVIILSYYEYTLYKKKVGGAINDVKNVGGGIFKNIFNYLGL